MNKSFIPALCILFLSLAFTRVVYGQNQLRNDIQKILATVQADVGIAVKHLERGDTLTFKGKDHFPMQSVYKFHLALAVLDQVEKGKISIDQKISIRKEDLLPNSWSPIAKKYPDGNVELTIQELLSYTVAQSDNSGCDILFRVVGGPLKVEEYIKNLEVKEVGIVYTEEEMHKSWDAQFKNWSQPWSMVQLLDLFFKQQILDASNTNLLMKIMEETITGRRRIKGLLPEGIVVAHKTGMGSRDEKGILGALNDVGIVTLPDGNHFAIAAFISNAKEDDGKLEEIIAKVSKIIFDHFMQTKKKN